MEFVSEYLSPMGNMIMASDGTALTGLWFEGQKYFPENLPTQRQELPVFADVRKWLDIYFDRREPGFTPLLKLNGTAFQTEVWDILLSIPYGKTMTYGEIAAEIAKKRGILRMSSQAVGGAVGRNRISVIVPCHRVIGSDGSLTGYAGGIGIKAELLRIERHADAAQFR